MKKIDQQTIKQIGISDEVLMERAGLKVVEVVNKYIKNGSQTKVLVLAGTGNNGGDGFVVSRLLAANKVKVETILLGKKQDVKGAARVNLEILNNLGVSVKEIIYREQLKQLKIDLKEADIIIDALLGTGIKGELRGLYPDLIKLVNQSVASVISVDIPSGVEAGSGKIRDVAIKATETVTFTLPKLGLVFYPGAKFVGELKTVEIGIPDKIMATQDIRTNLITSKLANDLLPIRDSDTHKGNYGKLLVLAAAPGMTGAAYLTAKASLKIGAGLVTVGIPKSLNSIMEMKLTEAMTYPLSETKSGTLSKKSIPEIKKLLKTKDVLAIGPGLTVNQDTKEIVKQIIEIVRCPLVIDADGLNCIDDLQILKQRKEPTILTPHVGEMGRLINKSISEIKENKLEIAREFALEYNVVLVLKDARTIIATPQGDFYINKTGNAGLATGGSGDVLTGLISGLLVQQNIGLTAATILAVLLHGLTADLASKNLTGYSLLPSDLLNYLPKSIKKIRRR